MTRTDCKVKVFFLPVSSSALLVGTPNQTRLRPLDGWTHTRSLATFQLLSGAPRRERIRVGLCFGQLRSWAPERKGRHKNTGLRGQYHTFSCFNVKTVMVHLPPASSSKCTMSGNDGSAIDYSRNFPHNCLHFSSDERRSDINNHLKYARKATFIDTMIMHLIQIWCFFLAHEKGFS